MRQEYLERINAYFRKVRDVPYNIPFTANDEDRTCNGKHLTLAPILQREGLEVRPRICTFRWTDIEKLPKEMKVQSNYLPLDTEHLYLEGRFFENWYSIDATWDKRLELILPVNESIGASDNIIAVQPVKIYSPEESLQKLYEEGSEEPDDVTRFYKAFNEWLEAERGKTRR